MKLKNIRDILALWCIRLAKRLTTWGDTFDILCDAEACQSNVVAYNALPDFDET